VLDDRQMTTTESRVPHATGSDLPDPNLYPPTIARSGDAFAALRVVHLLARLPRGRPVPLGEIVTRLNAEYTDWSFSQRVVGDVIAQLHANWVADYRTIEGVWVEDGPSGSIVTIEDSPRTGPWLAEQAWRFAAACRVELDEFARGEGRATEG
jgi:hypothetical protein